MLSLYRDALSIRRSHRALGPNGDNTIEGIEWLDLGRDVVAFVRSRSLMCVVNTGAHHIRLPHGEVLVSSIPLSGTTEARMLSADAAVWLDV